MRLAKAHQAEWVDIDELATPKNGETMIDRWWIVDRSKEKALFVSLPGRPRYWSPQCNHDERIARHIRATMYPECDIMMLPVVFLGHGRPYSPRPESY